MAFRRSRSSTSRRSGARRTSSRRVSRAPARRTRVASRGRAQTLRIEVVQPGASNIARPNGAGAFQVPQAPPGKAKL